MAARGLLCLCLFGFLGSACGRAIGIRETRVGTPDGSRDGSTGQDGSAGNDGPTTNDGAGTDQMGTVTDGPAGGDSPVKPMTDGAVVDMGVKPVTDGGSLDATSDRVIVPPDAEVKPTPDALADATPMKPDAVEPPPCPTATATAAVGIVGSTSDLVNCSVPKLPALYAAVDSTLYASSNGCGGCMELENGQGRVVVQVADFLNVAPSGSENIVSLNRAALDKLASPTTNNTFARWRWVPCPDSQPITATLKSGSDEFDWEVLIQGYSNRLAKLEYLMLNNSWKVVKRESYNFFHESAPMGLPGQFRLTDIHGNILVSPRLIWPAADGVTAISLGVQFPPLCSFPK
jgi:hypothetical protein